MSNDDPPFVPLAICAMRHDGLAKDLGGLINQLEIIQKALVGDDLRGGIVKDIEVIKNKKEKGSLSGRDKALITASLITSASAIIVALR